MSFQIPLQTALAALFQTDYLWVVITTAVGYDYILTFSREVEYVWCRPWTWVSTLFVIVRFCGIFSAIVDNLVGMGFGSSFFPGPAEVCEIFYNIDLWIFTLFFAAAEFVMLLRVWAVYNRSRLILTILVVLFALEMISFVVANAIEDNPKNYSVFLSQILNYSSCGMQVASTVWMEVSTIFQVVNGAAMCILVIIQSARQSLQMYKMTNRWEVNHYVTLLVRQGVFYFIAMFTCQLINVLGALGKLPMAGWGTIVLLALAIVPICTLTPRFIISMRELHACDVRGDGIDSAFGFSSTIVGRPGSMIMFADAEQNEAEEMQEEVAETTNIQSC